MLMLQVSSHPHVTDNPVERARVPVAGHVRPSSTSCSSSAPSPETEEFESLEKRFHEELSEKLHERKISDCDPTAPRKLSEISLRERKLSGLSGKLSVDLSGEEQLSLQLVEKRQLRSFSRADEYLYAMMEDLAEWLNMLYPDICIDAENFMEILQTGEHLLKVRRLELLCNKSQQI